MATAGGLESRSHPVADPAQAERAGRHPGLRLPRRCPAHGAAHAAAENRRRNSSSRRHGRLACLRKNLHPGQRRSAARFAGRRADYSGEPGALHEIPRSVAARAAGSRAQRAAMEPGREGISPDDRGQEPRSIRRGRFFPAPGKLLGRSRPSQARGGSGRLDRLLDSDRIGRSRAQISRWNHRRRRPRLFVRRSRLPSRRRIRPRSPPMPPAAWPSGSSLVSSAALFSISCRASCR